MLRVGLGVAPRLQVEPKLVHVLEARGHLLADRQRLAAGELVARMCQEPGLAWLERQAAVAEDLVAERRGAGSRPTD